MKEILVLTTASSAKEARKLAKEILQARLAACVQLSAPVHSFYTWKGKAAQSKEIQISIKTLSSCYSRLEKLIRKLHSYEIPEIIAIPFSKGSKSYLSWMHQCIKG